MKPTYSRTHTVKITRTTHMICLHAGLGAPELRDGINQLPANVRLTRWSFDEEDGSFVIEFVEDREESEATP